MVLGEDRFAAGPRERSFGYYQMELSSPRMRLKSSTKGATKSSGERSILDDSWVASASSRCKPQTHRLEAGATEGQIPKRIKDGSRSGRNSTLSHPEEAIAEVGEPVPGEHAFLPTTIPRRYGAMASRKAAGVAGRFYIARGIPRPPLLHPEVEDVVKEHVGEQWRCHAPNNVANCPFRGLAYQVQRPC